MVAYEIWALGFLKDNTASDIEEFLGEYDDLELAFEDFEDLKVEDIFSDAFIEQNFSSGDYVELRIEEVEVDETTGMSDCIDVIESRLMDLR